MDSVRIINKKNVKDECVLIEFLYRKAMCIVEDGEEIIFYHNIIDKNPKYEFTDRYLYDDRKKLFDTDDIALQKVRIGLKKYIKAKAILDYYKEYTVIKEQKKNISRVFIKVIKDKDNALILQSTDMFSELFYMTPEEIRNEKLDKDEKTEISNDGLLTKKLNKKRCN